MKQTNDDINVNSWHGPLKVYGEKGGDFFLSVCSCYLSLLFDFVLICEVAPGKWDSMSFLSGNYISYEIFFVR